MSTPQFASPSGPSGLALERDRWGRPLVVPPEGGKAVGYTRCTTYVDALEDKHNLSKWQQRMVALGMAHRPELVLAASATDREDKGSLDRIAAQAMDAAQASAAATTGTALHSFTERIDRGQPLGHVPDAFRSDVDAYQRATDVLEPLCIETFTVLDELKIGGTPDRVVRYQGNAYIADVKTGSIEWGAGKIAMQLAVYSRSVPYTPDAGRSFYPEPVDQYRGIVIHLPAGTGTCTLHWIDLDAGWQAVQLATQVRVWRARRGLLTDLDTTPPAPADPPKPDLTAALDEIHAATTVDQLRALYTRFVTAGLDHQLIGDVCASRIPLVEHPAA